MAAANHLQVRQVVHREWTRQDREQARHREETHIRPEARRLTLNLVRRNILICPR